MVFCHALVFFIKTKGVLIGIKFYLAYYFPWAAGVAHWVGA